MINKTYFDNLDEAQNYFDTLQDKIKVLPVLFAGDVKNIAFFKPDCTLEEQKKFINFNELNKEGYENSNFIPQRNEEKAKELLLIEVLRLIKGKDWGEATEILVNYIKKNLYIYTTKSDKNSEMWVYKKGEYTPEGRSEIKILLREILKEWYSTYIVNLVTSKIEADTYIDFKTFFSNNYIDEVPLLNGILNLKTKQLSPFNPKKIFFNKLPIKYDPNAKCPQIENFLKEVLPNEEDKSVFYEIGGFCLINEYIFEKAFMFIGAGRNGKDKTLELIKRILGINNCASLQLNVLSPDSFAISELFGKKANLAGELSNQDLKDSSSLKALTGRSLLSANRKGLNYITFVNHAKLIFACNDLPMVYDTEIGFWDRWVLLEFQNTFLSEKEYENVKDKSNVKIRDPEIIEKITTKEELSGLLNKFLEGLDRLFIQKEFSQTKSTEEVKNLWIRKSNSFIAFCMDSLEECLNGRIETKELRKRYLDYCKQYKIKSKSDVLIKRILQDQFACEQRQSSVDFGLRFWEGIKWK